MVVDQTGYTTTLVPRRTIAPSLHGGSQEEKRKTIDYITVLHPHQSLASGVYRALLTADTFDSIIRSRQNNPPLSQALAAGLCAPGRLGAIHHLVGTQGR